MPQLQRLSQRGNYSTTGGGGGQTVIANVQIGPDFGNPGHVGDTFVASGTISFDSFEAAFDKMVAQGAVTAEQIDVSFDVLGAAGAVSADLVEFDYTRYLNSASSLSGWTLPSNWTGNNTNSWSSLTASSSGVGGTTSNTTNGTIEGYYANLENSGLTITSDTIINIERSVVSSGTLPTGQSYSLQWDYSTNNGASWTNLDTESDSNPTGAVSLAKGTRTFNVGTLTQAQIDGLEVRCVGSVTSGTGLNAQLQARAYRAWFTVSAERIP